MPVPTRIILRGMFGNPILQWLKNNGTESNGYAEWTRDWRRYGQWTAKLSPGTQTDDDYGSVSWDVNAMPLRALNAINYVYRMGATEVVAPNVSIHVYDPNDIDNRADITLSHSESTLPKTSGWRKFDLTTAIDACFYYGNNIPTTTGLTENDGTSATLYTLAQYQADAVFKDYVIGKITIEYGYYSTGFLSPAHICKVEVLYGDGDHSTRVDLELVPSIEEQLSQAYDALAEAQRVIPTWTFGEPTVFSHNNSRANWERGRWDVSTHQKGHNMWNARLYGGLQTGGASAAGASIPVNEIPVSDFDSAKWSYFLDAAHAHGVNIVLWAHDPDVPSRRVEITQSGSSAGVGKGAGQNTNIFPYTGGSGDMFYVGEIVGAGTPDTCPTQYVIYLWTQFQADSVFSRYTIFKITFEFGMLNDAVTFTNAYLEEAILNGTSIQLQPADGKFRETIAATKTLLATEKVAGDVFSNAVSTNGTAWSWSFGGTGYITKAIIDHNAAVTPRVRLHLWGFAITDSEAEMDDSDAFNGPVAAGLPYYIGYIDFPALHYSGSGDAISIATPNTPACNIPLEFNTQVIYGVTETLDTFTPAATACNIHLTADMEAN